MKAIGFRADPNTIYWAVVEGPREPLVLLGSGKLPAPKTYDEASSLAWFRNQVRTLVDEYHPEKVVVRYPEPTARKGAISSANCRVRIEGVILEACHSKGIPLLTGSLVTFKSQLRTESPKAYLETGQCRGLDFSSINDYRREAIVAAAAGLGSPDAETGED